MKTHRNSTGFLWFLICFWIPTAIGAVPAGTVVTVKGTVSVQSTNGEASFLGKGSNIFSGDTITSAKKSFAVLKFTDDSKVVLRGNSVFKVEGYSFGEGQDNSSFNLVKGGIRALTGAIARENPDNFKLETPVASLGVRGTNFDASYCPPDANDCENEEQESSGKARAAVPAQGECAVSLDFTGVPPGGYFFVRDGRIYLSHNGQILELGPGDVAFADESRLGCLPSVPNFLDTPQLPFTDTEDFREFSPLQCVI